MIRQLNTNLHDISVDDDTAAIASTIHSQRFARFNDAIAAIDVPVWPTEFIDDLLAPSGLSPSGTSAGLDPGSTYNLPLDTRQQTDLA